MRYTSKLGTLLFPPFPITPLQDALVRCSLAHGMAATAQIDGTVYVYIPTTFADGSFGDTMYTVRTMGELLDALGY